METRSWRRFTANEARNIIFQDSDSDLSASEPSDSEFDPEYTEYSRDGSEPEASRPPSRQHHTLSSNDGKCLS